jgi:hypothetical protein
VFTPPEFCANSTELDMEFRKRRFYYMFWKGKELIVETELFAEIK